MASRKTATTEKPAATTRKAAGTAKTPASKGTAAKAAGKPAAKKATAAKSSTAKAAGKPVAKKAAPTKTKAAGTKAGSTARKAPARKAAAPAAARAGGKPSARASKKALVAPPRTKAAKPGPHGASFDAAKLAAEAALDKKAEDVVILDVRGLTSYADYFVVASGASDRQVGAIADSIEEKMKKAGHRTIGVEGYTRGHWVLIDFGDVVAHVFYEEARAFYDIEGLWADATRIPVE